MTGARKVELIETWSNRGDGSVNCPTREIREYWTTDGTKVAEVDPCLQRENGGLDGTKLSEEGRLLYYGEVRGSEIALPK